LGSTESILEEDGVMGSTSLFSFPGGSKEVEFYSMRSEKHLRVLKMGE
jgi:hypothetical protein